MNASWELINYALWEMGYECETRDGLYMFKRITNPRDMSETLNECFGEGRKVYAITADALVNLGFHELVDRLDRVDW